MSPSATAIPALAQHDLFPWLARSLSPWNQESDRLALRAQLASAAVPWERLLRIANLHFCTPLWYLCLRRDGLLGALPPELAEYLALLHAESVERNELFAAALHELLLRFAAHDLPVVLLKGAATFCDRLYDDGGARMMGDLDLLIPPARAREAQAHLEQLGYLADPPHRDHLALFADNGHHHLPRRHRPGSPVVIELHTRLARRQGGRLLPEAQVWAAARPATLAGAPALLPAPHHRLLHNAVHATLPHREFIRSHLALPQVIEFSWLAQRYGAQVEWAELDQQAARHGFRVQWRAWLALAHRLTGMPHPAAPPRSARARLHTARLLLAQRCEEAPAGSVRTRATRWLLRAYYRCTEPAWLLRNFFWQPGAARWPLRLRFLLLRYRKGLAALER